MELVQVIAITCVQRVSEKDKRKSRERWEEKITEYWKGGWSSTRRVKIRKERKRWKEGGGRCVRGVPCAVQVVTKTQKKRRERRARTPIICFLLPLYLSLSLHRSNFDLVVACLSLLLGWNYYLFFSFVEICVKNKRLPTASTSGGGRGEGERKKEGALCFF